MELILLSGCKSKRKIRKKLDMLRTMINLKTTYYEEEER